MMLVAVVALSVATSVSATPWSEVRRPSSGMTEVIGGASNGCIAGAQTLPATGPGYVSVRRYRNRYYGHPELLSFIDDLGRSQARRGNGVLMVGDLSQPRGGRMSSSHRSHQNGLDVDIWFTLASSPAEANRLMGNRPDPQSMVAPGGRSVSRFWGPDQQALIESAARHPKVDRIFVNAAIKQALCQSATGERSWLRKVRPWWKHDAHFHVRLVCPPGSTQCKAQSPVPAGDGCGQELAWWLSDEALKPSKKGGGKPSTPSTPAACAAVLKDS
nr:penicillin-insensitive murein endopeptidase [Thiocystis violacea]